MAQASILSDAAQLALQNAGIDITGLGGAERATAQALVSRAIDQEWKPETLAARLNPVLGLGPRYATAVENYRSGLAASKKLSPAQITSRVDAYTRRLKTARSRTVASYEMRKQQMDAQRLRWQQDQAIGVLPVDAVKRFHYDWHERGCALCYSQNNGVRSISDPFGPPLHPNCGCYETVHVHDTARGKVPLVKNRFLVMDGDRTVLTKDVLHWIESLHPRVPKGSGKKSGEFAPKSVPTVGRGQTAPPAKTAGTRLLAQMRTANASDVNGDNQKRIVNRLHADKLATDEKAWPSLKKALLQHDPYYGSETGDADDHEQLENMWARSVGTDEDKTAAAAKAYNRKQLIALHARLKKIDPAFLKDAVTEAGVRRYSDFDPDSRQYGEELYNFLRSDDPGSFGEDRYQMGSMLRQVGTLQGYINTLGNDNKISSLDHVAWSNATSTDQFALDRYAYARHGLLKYEVDLPDLNTDAGKAKVWSYAFTRRVVDGWADSSTSPQSLAFQMAASELAKELGFQAADFTGPKKYATDAYKEAEKMYKDQRLALLDLARSMYEETQKDFKAKGVTMVHASRGMSIDKRAPWMKGKSFGDQEVDAIMNPLSSWTTDIDETSNFSSNNQYEMVARWDIPVKQIFCTALTGLGCLHEYELLPFGIESRMRIRWLDSHETDDRGDPDYLRGGAEPSDYASPSQRYHPTPAKKAAKKHPAQELVVPPAKTYTVTNATLKAAGIDPQHYPAAKAYLQAQHKLGYAMSAYQPGHPEFTKASLAEGEANEAVPVELWDNEKFGELADKAINYGDDEGFAAKDKAQKAAAKKAAAKVSAKKTPLKVGTIATGLTAGTYVMRSTPSGPAGPSYYSVKVFPDGFIRVEGLSNTANWNYATFNSFKAAHKSKNVQHFKAGIFNPSLAQAKAVFSPVKKAAPAKKVAKKALKYPSKTVDATKTVKAIGWIPGAHYSFQGGNSIIVVNPDGLTAHTLGTTGKGILLANLQSSWVMVKPPPAKKTTKKVTK